MTLSNRTYNFGAEETFSQDWFDVRGFAQIQIAWDAITGSGASLKIEISCDNRTDNDKVPVLLHALPIPEGTNTDDSDFISLDFYAEFMRLSLEVGEVTSGTLYVFVTKQQ